MLCDLAKLIGGVKLTIYLKIFWGYYFIESDGWGTGGVRNYSDYWAPTERCVIWTAGQGSFRFHFFSRKSAVSRPHPELKIPLRNIYPMI